MALAARSRLFVTSLIFAGMLASSIGCASPRGRVYVRVAPPAPIVEARVVAPGPGYFWVPGYYVWNGAAYAWRPGLWERAPRARAVWVPGRWVRDRRHGWYFVAGRWR